MRLRAFNGTQATVITPDIALVDTAHEPFNVISRYLKDLANSGIWLNPFRGIPLVSGISPMDVLYIDGHQRVLGCVKGYTQSTVDDASAESALILPSGGIDDGHIEIGDQLQFFDAVTGALWASRVAGLSDLDLGEKEESTASDPQESLSSVPESKTGVSPEVRKVDSWQPEVRERPGALKRAFGWLMGVKEPSSDRRKGERYAISGLVAYFWTGGAPKAYEVANISTEGFYLLTEERWIRGTTLLVSLQIGATSEEQESRLSIYSRVVWAGSDGVGFAYVLSQPVDAGGDTPQRTAEMQFARLQRFLERLGAKERS